MDIRKVNIYSKHQYLKVQFFERGDCGFYMSFLLFCCYCFVLAENRVTIAYLFSTRFSSSPQTANGVVMCAVAIGTFLFFFFFCSFFSRYMYFCVDGFINENNHCHFHVGH